MVISPRDPREKNILPRNPVPIPGLFFNHYLFLKFFLSFFKHHLIWLNFDVTIHHFRLKKNYAPALLCLSAQ